MSSLTVSTLRGLADRSNDPLVLGSIRRVQGRPARGENEVGSQKIVEGMRAALRVLQNTNVSRKDIALHAGVTPALVTYYFPERNSLIEAATLPIAQALVSKIRACIERDGPTRQHLVQAIEVLLEYYTRDVVVIDLFIQHRASSSDTTLPDLTAELDDLLRSFFERWLRDNPGSIYDAEFLRKGMMGACRSIARRRSEASGQDTAAGPNRRGAAEMVCSMFLGPVIASEATEAISIGVGETVS